ncbi:hypothetical protein Tco_1036341, partial [Tanacetum coccineum]
MISPLTQRYEMSMMGILTCFLGFQIKQSERGISINQEKYVKDLLKKYDINGSSVKTSIVPPNKLGPDLNGKAANETRYRGIIGSLMYLTASKPDIQFSSCLCARYQANPKESYLITIKRIFSAKKQQSITMSSAEAEYVVAARCCANILCMKSQLTNYDIIYENVPIFYDNSSAIAISDIILSENHILKGDIELHFISTQYQLVDIFTKPRDEQIFKRLIVELDVHDLRSVKTKFQATVFNDELSSEKTQSYEPTVNETSLSEYDEVEQNVLYFNDLFPFNIMYPNNLKSGKDNNDNEIDIIQSSGDMAPLLPRDQRHLWLLYQVEGYTMDIVHDFEKILEMIFRRQVYRVHTLDFEGLTLDMRQDLAERLRMVYTRDDRQEIFVSHAWRRLFEIRAPLLGGARRSMTWRHFILALGLHTAEEMIEGGFKAYWLGSERVIPDKGDLS